MSRLHAAASTFATIAGATAVMAAIVLSAPAPLPPCATEDSVSCHWDGSTQGNGKGMTFDVRPDGTLYNVQPARPQ